MSRPLTYLVRDVIDDSGRTICLSIEKSCNIEESLALFNKRFGEGPNIETLGKLEFFTRYCNFVPETVKEMTESCLASGFVWSSYLFFNYR